MYREFTYTEKRDTSYSNYCASLTLDKHVHSGQYACIVGRKSDWTDASSYGMQVSLDKTQVTAEELLEWSKFLNEAGFLQTAQLIDDKTLFVDFPENFYKGSWTLFLAAFTAFRYPFYQFNASFQKIPKVAIRIKNQKGDEITEFEALQLAHYQVMRNPEDTLHCLMKTASKLVTFEKFEQSARNGLTIQSSFKGDDVGHIWPKLHDLSLDELILALK